jgi:endonuclease/exonuclease/phosphatase family metal-dependent hydrolase
VQQNGLKIASFNTFGIPLTPLRIQRAGFMFQNIKELSPEVVFLQEVFPNKRILKLLENISREEYPYLYPDLKIKSNHGGLRVLSKQPLTYLGFTKFRRRLSKNPLSLSDHLAGKGFQTFKTSFQGEETLILHTHLSANYSNLRSEENVQIRQINQILKTLLKHTYAKLVLVGDINIKPDSGLHNLLQNTAGFYDPLASTQEITVEAKKSRDDYCLLKGFSPKQITQTVIFKEIYQNKRKSFNLSDHYGLLTEVQ